MRLFPLALKDKANECFKSIGQGFNFGCIMERILEKLYSFGKTKALGELLRSLPKEVIP